MKRFAWLGPLLFIVIALPARADIITVNAQADMYPTRSCAPPLPCGELALFSASFDIDTLTGALVGPMDWSITGQLAPFTFGGGNYKDWGWSNGNGYSFELNFGLHGGNAFDEAPWPSFGPYALGDMDIALNGSPEFGLPLSGFLTISDPPAVSEPATLWMCLIGIFFIFGCYGLKLHAH